jgi:glyoxylase-like metal-dependent hydrolase (beta-lactamase superfamily II)
MRRRNKTLPNAPEVADRVFRLGTRWANFYLVAEDGEFTVVDTGYPGYWRELMQAVDRLGATASAITGAIVTHHHVDHAGTAERLSRVGASVLVHKADAAIVRGERRSHVPPGFYRQAWRPSMARYLAHTVAVGGAKYRPASSVEEWDQDQILDLPGRPRIVHTPGHTAGHCSVVLEERGVLFSGDAMVKFDYASGARGLNQHRFNADRGRALASLARLDDFDVGTVLFGHGEPWTGGSRAALTIVRERAAGTAR